MRIKVSNDGTMLYKSYSILLRREHYFHSGFSINLTIVHTFGKGFAYKPKLINYLAYMTWISRMKNLIWRKKTTLRLTPLFMTTKVPAVFDQATHFALQR